jgi:hypothetical protein
VALKASPPVTLHKARFESTEREMPLGRIASCRPIGVMAMTEVWVTMLPRLTGLRALAEAGLIPDTVGTRRLPNVMDGREWVLDAETILPSDRFEREFVSCILRGNVRPGGLSERA